MKRVEEYFNSVCKRPLMYAGYREALVAILSTLLNVAGKSSNLYDLFPRSGAAVLTLNDRLDEEFADLVVKRARQLWNE